MHIPLAKLTMTSLKESFCPVKKLQVVKSIRCPFSSFLLQVSFFLCLIQLSTLHQLKVYPFWMLLLLLMWFSTCRFNYILFNLFDDWHFPFFFFQIALVTSFQFFVNLWRHYYVILLFEFFIIWTIKLLYTCTNMYKYSPVSNLDHIEHKILKVP